MARRILVVPAGTEIGHEIHDSLEYSRHWDVHGANYGNDHSSLIYRNIHLGFPNVYHDEFVDAVLALAERIGAELVVPAHDEAIFRLSSALPQDRFLGPDRVLATILRSKKLTLAALRGVVGTPFEVDRDNPTFPLFLKPDKGQGSRGAVAIHDKEHLQAALEIEPDVILQELLTGEEITIDCFSDIESNLLYAKGRMRQRTLNGIATRTAGAPSEAYWDLAAQISVALKINGAWFFQMKLDALGNPKLLEVANRIAGSSGFQRMRGINLIEAWLHQKSGRAVAMPQHFIPEIIIDRALYAKVDIRFRPKTVYVDFDDTIILQDGEINYKLIGLLFGLRYRCGCSIQLITRHDGVVEDKLSNLSITHLFDDVHHLKKYEPKSTVIQDTPAVFIDDSFKERNDVAKLSGVFPLPVECLETLEGIIEGWQR